MAACHLSMKRLCTIWLALFLFWSTTIAEEPTKPVPTEPQKGPNSNAYTSSSWVSSFVTTSTKITASASSLQSGYHRISSSTGSVISNNNVDTSSQNSQTIMTSVDKYGTSSSAASAVSSSAFTNIRNTVSSSLNPATSAKSSFIIPSKTQTSVAQSLVSSNTAGTNPVTSTIPSSATSHVQKAAASSSSLQTENVSKRTPSSNILPGATVVLSSSSSFVQKEASSAALGTENMSYVLTSSSIILADTTKALVHSSTSSLVSMATISSVLRNRSVLSITPSSSIVPNTTGLFVPGLITSTIVSSSSVCIGCNVTSSTSSVVQNSTVFGVSPSPSLSRSIGIWNQTTFATRTLSYIVSSMGMKESSNSSSFFMTSTTGMNMSKNVLNRTAALSMVPTSSFINSSFSRFMAQTSTVLSSSEGEFATLYSEPLTSTASSSLAPSRTSSVVLSTPTTPPVYAPSAPPQDVKVYNTSSTSILITWRPPPSDTINGVLTKYEVLVQKPVRLTATPSATHAFSAFTLDSTFITIAPSSDVRTTQDAAKSISANSTSLFESPTSAEIPVEPTSPPKPLVAPINAGLNLSIVVRNLEKFTFYKVRVRAVTLRPGPYSSPLTVRTDEDVPSACRKISLSNQNSTSVMVHWTRPLEVNGVLLGYKIYYGSNESRFSTKDVASDVETNLLDGLIPYTLYIIKVTAYTRKGQGAAISTSFKTLEAVPSAIRTLTGKPINSTAVQISWRRPQYPNGEIEYVVMKRKASGEQSIVPVKIYQGPDTQCVVVGLKPVTRYVFSVYAMNIKRRWQSVVVDVTVLTPPSEPGGPPLDIQAITKNSTSILVHWQPPSPSLRNGLIKNYDVQYSTDKTTYQSQATKDNSTILLLTSLTPYTLYYIRTRAVNLAGAGPFSELVMNRTFEDAPSPPTNITARSVNATCVLVTWSEPEHLNGEMISYKLFYRMTSGDVSQNSLVYDGESTMYLVSGLHEYVSYTFTLFAYNVKYRYESASVVAVETTHPSAPSGPPQNTRAITLSSRSILVQWNPPKALDMNGLITGYLVTIKHPADGTNNSRSWSGSNNMLVFTSLRPHTVYFFTVQAVNKVGAGPPSLPVSNTTFEEVPDAPIIDQVANLSSTILQVSWLSPRNPNGALTAFQICWDLVDQTGKICNETDGTTRTLNICRLVPYSLYNISISAATSKGYGPSVSAVCRTMEGVPDAPRNLGLRNTSATSILVTWTAPAKINGILTSYQVSFRRSHWSSGFNTSSAGLSTNITLQTLKPFTRYLICVAASTSQGFGPQECGTVSTDEGVPGAVMLFDALTVTSNTIELKWNMPVDPNGNIDYILQYYSTLNPGQNKTYRFPGIQLNYTVTGLDPYTNYTFSIRAYNLKKGLQGPPRLLVAKTKAAKPSGPPLNVRLVSATTSSLTISWDPPAKPNGPIKSYSLMINEVKTPYDEDYQTVYGTTHTIPSLRPWHRYSIHIACSSSAGMGPTTKAYIFRTLHSVPPEVPSMKPPDKGLITANEITIELQKASDENGEISFYQVVVLEIATDGAGDPLPPKKNPDDYKPSDLLTYQEAMKRKPDLVPYIAAEFSASDFYAYRMFRVGDGKNYSIGARKRRDTDGQYYNGPLKPGTFYSMFQRAAVSKDLYRSTSWLNPVSTTESSDTAATTSPSTTNIGLIVGLCVTFLFIIIFIVIVFTILWKKRRFDFGVMLDDEGDYMEGRSLKLKKIRSSRRKTSSRGLMGSTDSLDNIDDVNRKRHPIPIEEFDNHVRRMHTDGDIGFSEEYELVQPNDEEFTWHHSLHSANKYKNRYANVVAYDHSRVLLTPIEGVTESDYINANYIDGYNRSGAYIACQGPLPETFDDFWRMIWEQGTATIVMLTQLEERGRRKCDQYWPDRGTRNYGVIRVTASEASHMSYYILRTFILSHKQEEEEPRQVKQYHFTSWPDHGVPTHPAPLLSLVRTVANNNPPTAGPAVIHCSAGVGRTGTFITLDAMLQKIEKEQTIDVFEFVRNMRTKRNLMVQTESQYVFIYDALNEAVSCGVTEFEAKKFSGRLRELREVDPKTGRTYLEKEFLRLVKDERHHSTFKNANLGINSSKNRYANILPYEKTRVHLKMRPGEVGSDYINASYIDGYCRLSAFIATQAPLPDTFEDFWRMIWEQGSSAIVMLTREEEAGKVKCHRYWPPDSTRIFGNVLVELTEEVAYSDYVMRQFSLTHTEEKEVRTVRQFQYVDWPDVGLPESGVGVIDLIGQVEKWQQQSSNSIITVHCSGGVGRTGVFCAVSILIERVKAEGVIDVFQTVQSLRLQRPAMVQTLEQYEFCYSTLQEYLDSFDLYANFQ